MIKKGTYCIFDDTNTRLLRNYDLVIVKVIQKKPWSKEYLVAPIEPVVFPVREDGYTARGLIVPERLLTPCPDQNNYSKYVIRYPIDMPVVSYSDIQYLEDLVSKLENNFTNLDRLRSIIVKLKYYEGLSRTPGLFVTPGGK